jgi:hypothetical protein
MICGKNSCFVRITRPNSTNSYIHNEKLRKPERIKLLWPIPQAELDKNTKLVQNPGY